MRNCAYLCALLQAVGRSEHDLGVLAPPFAQVAEQRVAGIGAGVSEGGKKLLQGTVRGLTGLVSKPIQGAQNKGLEGAVVGMAQVRAWGRDKGQRAKG